MLLRSVIKNHNFKKPLGSEDSSKLGFYIPFKSWVILGQVLSIAICRT